MDAGDALHGLAVAQRQAAAVHVFQHAQVGLAVPGDFDVCLARQLAGHGLAPQQFATELAVGVAVDAVQLFQRGGDVAFGRGDELQQGFGVIGGDLRMRQGAAQRRRMRGRGQVAIRFNPQGFSLDAAQAAQHRAVFWLGQQGQTASQ